MLLKRILVVGGDERAMRLASLLEKEGYEVRTIGLHAEDERTADIGEGTRVAISVSLYGARGKCADAQRAYIAS